MTSEWYGVNSSAGRLVRVGMRRPVAMLDAEPARWHYSKPLVAEPLLDQYDTFVAHVEASGAEIAWLPDHGPDGAVDDLADSVFTYDPSFVVPAGAVILRPGKTLRRPESELHEAFYEREGVPIIGRIEAPGTIEGGDSFWLDPTTLAVGRGFRTNQSGIDQFAALLAPHGIEVAAFDLPYHRGPDACLHLMSVVSALDSDLALVHAPLMPTALYQRMQHMGYTLLEAPVAEFEASSGLNLNVLATGPRQAIAVDGFPGTVALMRDAGCDVTTFRADELCLPCEGGPTCLTRPLRRA
jgi:N-dimethylarginine dimethylaminohydrolase